MNNKTQLLQKVALVLAILGASLSISAQQAWINDGLVAYYPFNGNANDESGNGNNGSEFRVKYAADRFGSSSGSIEFVGRSQLRIAHKAQLDFGENKPMSISFWMKRPQGDLRPPGEMRWTPMFGHLQG
mgnify:CR=1 FL=1